MVIQMLDVSQRRTYLLSQKTYVKPLALLVFSVPIKGSFLMLTLCTLLYLIVTTGIGMVTSTFTKTQVAAVFITAMVVVRF